MISPIKYQPIQFKPNGEQSCNAIPFLGTDKLSFQFNVTPEGAYCEATELICNGGFDKGTTLVVDGQNLTTTNWVETSGFTFSGGNAYYTPTNTDPQGISQVIGSYANDKYYVVEIQCTTVNHALSVSIGDNTQIIPAGTSIINRLYFPVSANSESTLELNVVSPDGTGSYGDIIIYSVEMYNICWEVITDTDAITVFDNSFNTLSSADVKQLFQYDLGLTENTTYQVTVVMTDNGGYLSGQFQIGLGGNYYSVQSAFDGTNTYQITTEVTPDFLDEISVTFTNDFAGSILSISIEAYTPVYLVDIYNDDNTYIASVADADIVRYANGETVGVMIDINDYITETGCYRFALVDQCSTDQDISEGTPIGFTIDDYTYVSNLIKVVDEICEPNLMIRYRHDTSVFGFDYRNVCFYFYLRLVADLNMPSFDDTGSEQFNYSTGKVETTFFTTKVKEQLAVTLYPRHIFEAINLIKGHRVVFIDDVLYVFELGEENINWIKESNPMMGTATYVVKLKTQNLTSKICGLAPPSCESDESLLIDPQNDYVIDPVTGNFILSNG